MKKTRSHKRSTPGRNGLRPEYRFDYRKARRNRFASQYRTGSRIVVLDPDIARVFTTPESVNSVLRAILGSMPRAKSSRRPA